MKLQSKDQFKARFDCMCMKFMQPAMGVLKQGDLQAPGNL